MSGIARLQRPNLTGWIALYRMTEADEGRIRRMIQDRGGNLVQNNCRPGETFPMMITRDFGRVVNGKVFLDADFDLSVFSVAEGTGPGTWSLPGED